MGVLSNKHFKSQTKSKHFCSTLMEGILAFWGGLSEEAGGQTSLELNTIS